MKQLKHNPNKVQAVAPTLQALLSKDGELKVPLHAEICTSMARQLAHPYAAAPML
jgi:hypothetical protein